MSICIHIIYIFIYNHILIYIYIYILSTYSWIRHIPPHCLMNQPDFSIICELSELLGYVSGFYCSTWISSWILIGVPLHSWLKKSHHTRKSRRASSNQKRTWRIHRWFLQLHWLRRPGAAALPATTEAAAELSAACSSRKDCCQPQTLILEQRDQRFEGRKNLNIIWGWKLG